MKIRCSDVLRKKTVIMLLVFCVPAILLVCIFLGCNSSKPSAKPSTVIFISIDTCRADRLSCYGYKSNTTPNLDRLAGDGTLFKNVIAPAPITLPAHSTMLTGSIPPGHGVRDNIGYQLPGENVTLAEILKSNGYSTSAVVSSFVLDSSFGLDQGFDVYDDQFDVSLDGAFGSERRGGEATNHAIQLLRNNQDKDHFLFLHYYDPHMSYSPPEPFATKFKDDLYAGEIAYVDDCIGKLISYLRDAGLYDSSLIVVAGDHGEMLGEHGEKTHTYFIYQSAVKVPMIIKQTGKSKKQRLESIAGLIDITPTICGMLGIDPPVQSHGYDLAECVKGQAKMPADRAIYCESITAAASFQANMLSGVVTDKYKYIHTTRDELYDLTSDPGENNNIIDDQRQRGRILQDRLDVLVEESVAIDTTGSGAEVDEDSLAKLRSLGYVGSDSQTDVKFDKSKKDPKDLIGAYNDYQQFLSSVRSNQTEKALKLARKIVANCPMIKEPNLYLAIDAMRTGDYAKAIVFLERLVILEFELFKAHYNLGVAYVKLSDDTKAIVNYLKALEIKPKALKIYNELGAAYQRKGDSGNAIMQYKKSLELDSKQVGILGSIASAYSTADDYDNAVEYWNRALDMQPNWAAGLNNLAWIHVSALNTKYHDPAKGVELALRASSLTGDRNPHILDTLAAAYAANTDLSNAVDTIKTAIDNAGNDLEFIETLKEKLKEYEKQQAITIGTD